MKSIFYLSFCVILLSSCTGNSSGESTTKANHPTEPPVLPAWEKVDSTRELVALTANSSTSYFVYKGQTMGYEYELLKNLAEYLDVKLVIKPVDNLDSIFDMLNRGDGDIIAYTMTVTTDRKSDVEFTDPLYVSQQSLVQKKPDNWRNMMMHEIDASLVRNVLELTGKEVYVRKNSSYYSRLKNLSEEIGDSIHIVTVDGDMTTESLIDMVADGEISYTVADQEIAEHYATYNDIIDYKTPISMPQKMAWAVRLNSPMMRDTINAWLAHYKKYKAYYYTYDKYYKNPKKTRYINKSQFNSFRGGKLSPYDAIFKKESQRLDWDWRLLASQSYKESRFNPKEESWMGAIGLMQVLPSTGEMYNISNLYDPKQNVEAAVNYLMYLENKFAYMDSVNQIKFTLASYNVGLGHIYDAMRLASLMDKDSTIWDENVADMILLKSKRKYYTLPECRNGYCRGQEPFDYVKDIMDQFEDYKTLIK